jgi:hypothetical protein
MNRLVRSVEVSRVCAPDSVMTTAYALQGPVICNYFYGIEWWIPDKGRRSGSITELVPRRQPSPQKKKQELLLQRVRNSSGHRIRVIKKLHALRKRSVVLISLFYCSI